MHKLFLILIALTFTKSAISGELTLLNQLTTTSDTSGIKSAGNLYVSKDNKFLYVGSNNYGPISQFAIAPDGSLTYITSTTKTFTYIPDMAFSPDEKFVYIATYYTNTIDCYTRNESTGNLSFVKRVELNPNQNWFNIPTKLNFNKSGSNMYVISKDAISVFGRDSITGELDFRQMLIDESTNNSELGGVSDIDLSPDEKFAYVTSFRDSSISWYHRDSLTGKLTYLNTLHANGNNYYVLKRPDFVKVSKNGNYIIVASGGEGAIAWFTRNQTDGSLTFGGELIDRGPKIYGIYYLNDFHIFANETRLITAAEQSSALFSIDTLTGALYWLESINLVNNSSAGHPGRAVQVTHDNKYIYVASVSSILSTIQWNFSTSSNLTPQTRSSQINYYEHGKHLSCNLLGRALQPDITNFTPQVILRYTPDFKDRKKILK